MIYATAVCFLFLWAAILALTVGGLSEIKTLRDFLIWIGAGAAIAAASTAVVWAVAK